VCDLLKNYFLLQLFLEILHAQTTEFDFYEETNQNFRQKYDFITSIFLSQLCAPYENNKKYFKKKN